MNFNEENVCLINIHSDAHPTRYIPKEIADIHKVILENGLNPAEYVQNIYYKKINEEFVGQMIILHREWFPIKYSREYLLNFIHNKNCFTVGGFIKINEKEYLIGIVLFY